MTRMSKQGERRAVRRKRPSPPMPKTGPKQDALKEGFKPHANAIETDLSTVSFIPKIQ